MSTVSREGKEIGREEGRHEKRTAQVVEIGGNRTHESCV